MYWNGWDFRKKNTHTRKPHFLTLDHMVTPLKIKKKSKIGLRSDLSWPKLAIEPKCHDPGTFGGFGKQITPRHTDTLDSCFISIKGNTAFMSWLESWFRIDKIIAVSLSVLKRYRKTCYLTSILCTKNVIFFICDRNFSNKYYLKTHKLWCRDIWGW